MSELSDEREEITRSIVSRVLTETFAIARKLLGDLSDRNLEERIVEMFVRRLHSLSEPERSGIERRLAGSASHTNVQHVLTVRSAFELSAAQRASIDKELECVVPDGDRIRYDQAPELIGGIELTANGYRLRWSIEDYLVSLREQIDATLKPVAEA
jgi:F-type H+-transporting ATPase subunit b